MSDGGGEKTQVVTSNQAPWSGQQPYLQDVFGKAQSALNQGPYNYFPNSTVVPFSGQTETALTRLEDRANDPNSLVSQAQGNLGQTLGGDFLSAGNPYFSGMMDKVANQVRPRLDAQFSGAGRYGSGAHEQAAASALSDTAGQLAYQNYGAERDNQLKAGVLAPSMNTADITPLAQVGQTREALANSELQDQISRYNFNQSSQDEALRRYATLVAGGSYGGSSRAEQPLYSNPLMTGLGAASAGAGILGSLFGKGGAFGSGGFFGSTGTG